MNLLLAGLTCKHLDPTSGKSISWFLSYFTWNFFFKLLQQDVKEDGDKAAATTPLVKHEPAAADDKKGKKGKKGEKKDKLDDLKQELEMVESTLMARLMYGSNILF